MIVLITGPVRSGKSARAASVARAFGAGLTHVVTCRVDPTDAEMADRIARHRVDRGADPTLDVWHDGSEDLPAILAATAPGTTLVVDSLGTWLAGHLLDIEELCERDAVAAAAQLEAIAEALIAALPKARGNVVFVAEETGWGLVPITPQGRIFRDSLGRLTQRVGRHAERVELVVAGFALDLRSCATPVLG